MSTIILCNKCSEELIPDGKKSFFTGALVQVHPQIDLNKRLMNPPTKTEIHICDKCIKPLMEHILNDDKEITKA